MKEARYFYAPDVLTSSELSEEEALHAIKVLRLKSGDEIMLMDGSGNFYRAEVSLASSHRCIYEIKETLPQERQWKGHLHLAIAPTKMMDRMEWMVEKVTEVGIDEFSFLQCKFSERKVIKTERLEKIVLAAVKQSRKAWKPAVNGMETFKSFIEKPRKGHKYIAHCYEEVPRTYLFDELHKTCEEDDITVLIGPEGDFSVDEVRMAVEKGFVSVHLGKSRLRTETAGLSATMMMQLK
jgi:16S rRNA (uracil1498-N3)-methyltransferase